MDGAGCLAKTPSFDIGFRDTVIDRAAVDRPPPLEHAHDSCEMAFFLRSDIRVFLKDKQYAVTDGDLLFIDEYEIHRILYAAGRQYSRYVVNFKRSFIQGVLQQLGFEALLDGLRNREYRKLTPNLRQRGQFKERLDELAAAHARADQPGVAGKYAAADVKLKLADLLIALDRLYDRAGTPEAPAGQGAAAQKALAFLNESFQGEITLERMERELNISRFHLAHAFKETTGFTIMEYVQLRRIVEAQYQLKNTQKKIVEICFDCGFNSLQHFYRVFKSIAKCTPLEYRKGN